MCFVSVCVQVGPQRLCSGQSALPPTHTPLTTAWHVPRKHALPSAAPTWPRPSRPASPLSILQAIEFWNTVAEYELDLLEDGDVQVRLAGLLGNVDVGEGRGAGVLCAVVCGFAYVHMWWLGMGWGVGGQGCGAVSGQPYACHGDEHGWAIKRAPADAPP